MDNWANGIVVAGARSSRLRLWLTLILSVGIVYPSAVGTAVSAADKRGRVASAAKPGYKAIPAQQAETAMPPVAPERPILGSSPSPSEQEKTGNGFLTGSASATGMGASLNSGMGSRPGSAGMGAMVNPLPRYSPPINGGVADTGRFPLGGFKSEVVPPAAMKGWLERTHPEFNLSAQLNPQQVLEVKGQWDDAGQIMSNMDIRHQRIKGKEIGETLTQNTKVLVLNCEGRVHPRDYELVRQWVIRGGYLITTDWALDNFVSKAFPNTIAWSGSKASGVVDAVVVARDSAYLAGTRVPAAPWKLDEESQEVRILRPDTVQVLARSNKLASRDQQAQFHNPVSLGALAVTFAYGRGRVLHLVGHFDYNSGFGFTRNVLPDAIPGTGVGLRQAIATNFLIEGLERGTRRN